jgi:hypothetical protein
MTGGAIVHNRRLALGLVAAALLIVAARHPSANINILTHDQSDRAPHRMQAALDTGLFAVSLLITWTTKSIA